MSLCVIYYTDPDTATPLANGEGRSGEAEGGATQRCPYERPQRARTPRASTCANGPCTELPRYTPTPPTRTGWTASTRSTASRETFASRESTRPTRISTTLRP